MAAPIPFIPLTFAVIGNVVLGVLMLAIVLRFGREITPPLKNISASSPITSVIVNLVYLAAIGIAYVSFYPLVEGFLPDFVLMYSLVLFVVAVLPIGRISMAFYRSIDTLTYVISKRLVRPRGGADKEQERCPFCGSPLKPDTVFCTNCGAKVE